MNVVPLKNISYVNNYLIKYAMIELIIKFSIKKGKCSNFQYLVIQKELKRNHEKQKNELGHDVFLM